MADLAAGSTPVENDPDRTSHDWLLARFDFLLWQVVSHARHDSLSEVRQDIGGRNDPTAGVPCWRRRYYGNVEAR